MARMSNSGKETIKSAGGYIPINLVVMPALSKAICAHGCSERLCFCILRLVNIEIYTDEVLELVEL